MLDPPEEPDFAEIGIGEQAFEIGDHTVGDIENVEPLAPFGGGPPAHPVDDDFVELADVVGAPRQGREALVIGELRALDRLEQMRDCASVVARMQM